MKLTIAYQLEQMLESNNKGKYIKDIKDLNRYSVSNTNKFYSDLFKKLRK